MIPNQVSFNGCRGSLEPFFNQAFKPSLRIGIAEYCEKNLTLAEDTPIPGRVSFAETPYMYQIFKDLEDDNGIEEVRVKKGRQLGFTLMLVSWMLWGAAVSPAPAMVVFPTGDSKKKFSKQKLSPTLRRCRDLQGKILEGEDNDQDTIDVKNFPGGFINIASANSASSLRSSSVRRLGLDEQSAYPADCQGEGNPSDIAYGTTSAYGSSRKIFRLSTPTIEGVCPISHDVGLTQKYQWYVPCLTCETFQIISWNRIIFPEKTKSGHAEFECVNPECKARHRNEQKGELLSKGEWRSTAEDVSGGKVKGYILGALYAPTNFFSWDDAVRQFREAKGDLEKHKAFVNNVLGEAWEDPADSIDMDGILKLCGDYSTTDLPKGIGLVTAGIDTHPSHLDIVVKGWGRGQESWVLDYEVFHGDANLPETWGRVYQFLQKTYKHHTGVALKIAATCVDTGGLNTQSVYDFVGPLFSENIIGIKGVGAEHAPTIGRPSKNNEANIFLFPVGTHSSKSRVFGRLAYSLKKQEQLEKDRILEYGGPGVCHFPKAFLDSDKKYFFSQLTAPKAKHKMTNGRMATVYETNSGVADHSFDCYRYADAAFYYLNYDINQLCDGLDSGGFK